MSTSTLPQAFAFTLAAAAFAASACTATPSPIGTSSADVPLHGEAPVLPGFAYDTGLRPATGRRLHTAIVDCVNANCATPCI